MSEQTPNSSPSISPGIYEHYKGPHYKVLHVATHSETGEAHVVYQCLYGNYDFWIRPFSLFTEIIEVNGVKRPRFQYLGAS